MILALAAALTACSDSSAQTHRQPHNSRDLAEPLGSTTSGRLVFPLGAGGVTIQADPALPDFYRARFSGHIPSVQTQDGVVMIQYCRFSVFDGPISGREPMAEVTLNGSLPWEIEFRNGVSKLTADLSGLFLRSLDLNSASQVRVTLPHPSGAVYIYVSGSVSDLSLYRPPGVAVRVQISSSASNLTFDQQYFGAVVGEIHWQTPDYASAADRYDISVAGSASNLTIATR
jgi:hypothetical protein